MQVELRDITTIQPSPLNVVPIGANLSFPLEIGFIQGDNGNAPRPHL